MSKKQWWILYTIIVLGTLGKGYHSMWVSQMEEIGASRVAPIMPKEVEADIKRNYHKCTGMPTKTQNKAPERGGWMATTTTAIVFEQEEVCDEKYGSAE